MKPTTEMIKYVQQTLSLTVDGQAGPKTETALLAVSIIPSDWPIDRKIVGFIQHQCMIKEIPVGPIDGFLGPQTQYGFDQLTNGTAPWRDDEGIGATPDPSSKWPIQTQAELIAFYGPVGTNQVSVALPYPHKIAWEPSKVINNFTCHTKVASSVQRVLANVLAHYGLEEIQRLRLDMWGGGLNVRPMRGGTNYSTHAWGIAFDYDPENNQLKWGRDKASFARPEYDAWWKCWENEGWVSLGRERNYDWMHVQAARVK